MSINICISSFDKIRVGQFIWAFNLYINYLFLQKLLYKEGLATNTDVENEEMQLIEVKHNFTTNIYETGVCVYVSQYKHNGCGTVWFKYNVHIAKPCEMATVVLKKLIIIDT